MSKAAGATPNMAEMLEWLVRTPQARHLVVVAGKRYIAHVREDGTIMFRPDRVQVEGREEWRP